MTIMRAVSIRTSYRPTVYTQQQSLDPASWHGAGMHVMNAEREFTSWPTWK